MGSSISTYSGVLSDLGTNRTYTEPDGTIVCAGDATGWLDVFFPQAVPKTTGAGNPTLVTWLGNLRGYSYSVGDVNDFDPQEYPHNGQVGATGTWHIHFVARSLAVGDKYNWQIEFSQAAFGTTFPAPTTITAEYTVASVTPAAPRQIIFDLGTFTTLGPGSQCFVRLTRIAKSAGGTNPGTDPIIIGVHYHYPVDTPAGSRQIITK